MPTSTVRRSVAADGTPLSPSDPQLSASDPSAGNEGQPVGRKNILHRVGSAAVHTGRRWKPRRKRNAPGTAPGTLAVDPNSPQTHVRMICCQTDRCSERHNVSIDQFRDAMSSSDLVWVDVTGLGSHDILQSIAKTAGIHPLAMEDVLHLEQRAKVEQYADHLFVIMRMIDHEDALDSEQIAFVLRKNILITFQQRPGDCWQIVRTRMTEPSLAIRKLSADYIMYLLIDAMIDSYFPFLDRIADQLDDIDFRLASGRGEDRDFERIHALRAQLLGVRRIIRPHRDAINQLIRDEYEGISTETRVYLRDCYDHVLHVAEAADTYNEAAGGLRDYYMTLVSNRMNEIMKVLTIISSIFIPLSFIAGVYGMNFDTSHPMNMPELSWRYGYVAVLTGMTIVGVALLAIFRRKKWI